MTAEPLVEVVDLTVHFPVQRGSLFSRRTALVRAVDGISLTVGRGETLGLVGESGSGKTTVSRAIVGLQRPTRGVVRFDGVDLTTASRATLQRVRPRLQMIFQDPAASLDPRMTIEQAVAESLRVQNESREGARPRVREMLELVGLGSMDLHRYPHELSGGQQQRVAIARALVTNPSLIVADEPISALDVSVQAQVMNLLADLQEAMDLSYVLVAHNLSVVEHLSTQVAVMYLGKIVETAPAAELGARPLHPYSMALLSAVSVPEPSVEARRQRIILTGEQPSPLRPPSGCRFRTRCWLSKRLGDPGICREEEPLLAPDSVGHKVACHFVDEIRGDLVVGRGANK